MTAFWVVALCSLVEVDVSELHTVPIDDGGRPSASTSLLGGTSQKAAIFKAHKILDRKPI
jgi:hypothetical protein